jgi:transcriptional regulator with XRE-family HTH domain
MVLASVLRTARAESGMALRELARRLGIDAAHLSRVEQGKAKPSKALLVSISEALNVQQERLLTLGGFLPDAWQQRAEREALGGACEYSEGEGSPEARPLSVAEHLAAFGRRMPASGSIKLTDPLDDLFPPGCEVSPELNEIYELKLAMLEGDLLSKEELVQRGAYFVAVDGQPTNHFLICTGGGLRLPRDSGARLRSFIGMHRLKSSYATHGLFPYRGKFHPQMVKALLNIMGLRPGDTVLDPMSGSGTTAVEASLMGIDSVAIDASPFCTFLGTTKTEALTTDVSALAKLRRDARTLDGVFRALASDAGARRVRDREYRPVGMSRQALDLLALAYLDSIGYAERSARKAARGFFEDILGKYVDTIERFQSVWGGLAMALGRAEVRTGDARDLDLADNSIDGVLFSPPYSFAIDYLANDAPHLRFLGQDIETLRPSMIGLNAKGRRQQVEGYFADIARVLAEVARVLKPRRMCTVVVGSNSSQLASALGVPEEDPAARFGIESRLIQLGGEVGLSLELGIRRLIVGMANSMREEHILFLRKGV